MAKKVKLLNFPSQAIEANLNIGDRQVQDAANKLCRTAPKLVSIEFGK